MKFKIPVARFTVLAQRVLPFAASGQSIDPGFGLLHVAVLDKGLLRLSAHDPTAGARVMVKVTDFEPGAVALNSAQLDKLASILPDHGDMVVSTLSDARLRVDVGAHLRMDVPMRAESDCVPFPKPPTDGWFQVEEKRLRDVIKRCLWATCKDETRPAFAGVSLTSERSMATDGHVMSCLRPGLVPAGVAVVVPGDSWTRLVPLVEASTKKLGMCVEPNRVWFRGDDWAVSSQLIATSFPKTDDMIFDVDGDNIHHVGETAMRVHSILVNRAEALDVVKRIGGASVSQDARKIGASVAFELRDGEHLHFVSNYPFEDVGNSILVDERVDWSEDSVSVANPAGFVRLRDIGIYSYYMRMALSSLSSDVIKIMWADGPLLGNMPMQFHDEREGIVALVMPRRL
jgi:hypothetical protein